MAVDVGCPDTDVSDLVELNWRDGPPVEDARELLDRARRVDAEMSFATTTSETRRHPVSSRTVEVRTRLRRWTAPRTDHAALAAVLTFTPTAAGGPIVMSAVVDPDFRSTGVITAAFEALRHSRHCTSGLDADIVACAFGSHPAALRAAARFGARTVAQRDVLVPHSPLRPPPAIGADGIRPVPCGTEIGGGDTHSVWQHFDTGPAPAVYAATRGAGTTAGYFTVEQGSETTRLTILGVRPGAEPLAATLDDIIGAAAPLVRDRDPAQIEVTAATDHRPLLEALRYAGFHHDRTDVAFALHIAPDLVTPHK
ncbi:MULTISPECIES: hypothetical protein [Gordonia]|uniref:hypothetical protein n=1 Tax=Gordonia TaxID=2053 RepID=UPI003397649D